MGLGLLIIDFESKREDEGSGTNYQDCDSEIDSTFMKNLIAALIIRASPPNRRLQVDKHPIVKW